MVEAGAYERTSVALRLRTTTARRKEPLHWLLHFGCGFWWCWNVFIGMEATKSKYSSPSLQRLCRSGQRYMHRYLRAGSRWRRPCGNLSIPGQSPISNRSREVRPSIPSGSSFSAPQLDRRRILSLARSPRFEGSANKLLLKEMSIFSRDAGNLGIWSKL